MFPGLSKLEVSVIRWSNRQCLMIVLKPFLLTARMWRWIPQPPSWDCIQRRQWWAGEEELFLDFPAFPGSGYHSTPRASAFKELPPGLPEAFAFSLFRRQLWPIPRASVQFPEGDCVLPPVSEGPDSLEEVRLLCPSLTRPGCFSFSVVRQLFLPETFLWFTQM